LYIGRPPEQGGFFIEIDNDLICADGNRFELGERRFSGGNGVVHECYSHGNGELYAVKLLVQLGRSNRFARESQLIRTSVHDHLITYVNHGEKLGGDPQGKQVSVPFLVMEFAESNLKDYLQSEKSVGPEIYVPQFRGLASALGVLHKQAVHRDLKPSNILVVRDRWVIADVGLCRFLSDSDHVPITLDGEKVGPHHWQSPEAKRRSEGAKIDFLPSEDVYMLANIFWYVVTGRQWDESSSADWVGPPHLLEPLMCALEENPDQRPVDGHSFACMLESALP
jgi:serine/threonine-protein kinase